MVAGELCHVLVKTPPLCCPLLYRMLIDILYCFYPLSSCGEDMEASDGEGEEEILPPSKVITPSSTLHIYLFKSAVSYWQPYKVLNDLMT